MREDTSICVEIPVPWSEKPAIVRASGWLPMLMIIAGFAATGVLVFG